MFERKLTLHKGMIALTCFIIVFSLLVVGVFLIGNILKSKEEDLTKQAMLVSRTVASLPEIENALVEKQLTIDEKATVINKVVEKVRLVNNANYIVVTNMEQIRLSHPMPKYLGTHSPNTNDEAAYSEHYYTDKAKGEIGIVTRAFVPIMDAKHQQIGVVMTAYRIPVLKEVLFNMKWQIASASILSILFGLWGAIILSRSIKKQMHDYEPFEIARLYTERLETFNAMHEGIIAIDNFNNITIFNPKAKQILGVTEDRLIGKKINELLPDTRLPEILDMNTPVYNKELLVNNHSILSNRVPIIVDGQIVGAIAIFQDQTDVKKLAEELTGVQEFVQALRIQNHEHKNKMHTIAGLLQLGNHKEALNYIVDVQTEQDELSAFLNDRIHNQNISGLLLSKVNRGKELGIEVVIDSQSHLDVLPSTLDFHDFVVIIGNLIENSFDALEKCSVTHKEVFVSIDQNEDTLCISVEDNGIGMTEEQQRKVFENGYTTKDSKNHGIGLYLIHGIVQKAQGTIDINSFVQEGTSISILFDMH